MLIGFHRGRTPTLAYPRHNEYRLDWFPASLKMRPGDRVNSLLKTFFLPLQYFAEIVAIVNNARS